MVMATFYIHTNRAPAFEFLHVQISVWSGLVGFGLTSGFGFVFFVVVVVVLVAV